MTGIEGHRWLGYQPVGGGGFIAVCSCGWTSAPQRTAGLAGALIDVHRVDVRRSMAEAGDGGTGVDDPAS